MDPVCCLALCAEFDAAVRLVALGLEALIAGHDVAAGQKIGWTEAIGPFDDLGIEEGLAHAEERRGQENCVLVLCANLRLARTEGSQKFA